MSLTPTVGVICRVYIGELPYIKSFLDHYYMLGVDKIYIIITKKADDTEIRNYLKMYKELEYVYPINDEDVNMDLMNHLIPLIKEDYVLHVDIDEFLDLAPHNNIKAMIQETAYDKYRFVWAIVVNDGITEINLATYGQTHRNRPWKTMCKTSLMESWLGSHDVKTTTNVEAHFSKYNLIHYWGRTFNDIIIKSIYGNGFKDAKCCSLDLVMKYIDDESIYALPNRLKMLAVLSRCVKPIVLDIDYCLKYVVIEKETELLQDVITKEQIEKLYKKYVEFRLKLDYKTHIEPYFQKGLLGMDWDEIIV